MLEGVTMEKGLLPWASGESNRGVAEMQINWVFPPGNRSGFVSCKMKFRRFLSGPNDWSNIYTGHGSNQVGKFEME
jgi:hypothetical protein